VKVFDAAFDAGYAPLDDGVWHRISSAYSVQCGGKVRKRKIVPSHGQALVVLSGIRMP
jgi:hypothetical protein